MRSSIKKFYNKNYKKVHRTGTDDLHSCQCTEAHVFIFIISSSLYYLLFSFYMYLRSRAKISNYQTPIIPGDNPESLIFGQDEPVRGQPHFICSPFNFQFLLYNQTKEALFPLFKAYYCYILYSIIYTIQSTVNSIYSVQYYY